MSSKSAKTKKELKVPRTIPEIEQAYQQMCFKAGSLQYQLKVYGDELTRINEQLLKLNNEAAARKILDGQQATAETKTEEATSGQQ